MKSKGKVFGRYKPYADADWIYGMKDWFKGDKIKKEYDSSPSI